ncbi:aspartate/glutamate racemase family protein [Microbacterium sp. G2-8]|uniref:aspartate/glutamate racemase family protein n=1 Tax=Microbacterium sp. G2-8 TaxID=2842454 RepID=UPI001C890739|nr:aspartate/glutamate racemase family protein [Microbacterium sp. G2-8]
MRITAINPNTSRAFTDAVAAAAREAAGPGVEIVAVCPAPGQGPDAVESHNDEIAAARAVARLVQEDLASGGSDAYVVACFGDPGLDAARELVDVPVVGIAEAAMHLAAVAGRRFAIITTLSRTIGRAKDLLARYEFEKACAAVHGTEIPVLELERAGADAVAEVLAWCERAVRDDGADVIVLGCAGMAELTTTLRARLDVPVVDGVAAATGVALAMARAGIGTSKRQEYAAPPTREPAALADA